MISPYDGRSALGRRTAKRLDSGFRQSSARDKQRILSPRFLMDPHPLSHARDMAA
jgi:hypothetical protein